VVPTPTAKSDTTEGQLRAWQLLCQDYEALRGAGLNHRLSVGFSLMRVLSARPGFYFISDNRVESATLLCLMSRVRHSVSMSWISALRNSLLSSAGMELREQEL
jgi:hypothetical protein